jgi:hypothetical protein
MALPPPERRDPEKVNEAVRRYRRSVAVLLRYVRLVPILLQKSVETDGEA